MPVELEADRQQLLNAEEFGVEGLLQTASGTIALQGIFDYPYEGQLEGALGVDVAAVKPQYLVSETELRDQEGNFRVRDGDPLTLKIRGDAGELLREEAYIVRERQPDGTGMLALFLETA